jgi:hypothetical protein
MSMKSVTIIIRKDRDSSTYNLYYNDGYEGWAWPEHVTTHLRKDLAHALTPEETEGTTWDDTDQVTVPQ